MCPSKLYLYELCVGRCMIGMCQDAHARVDAHTQLSAQMQRSIYMYLL